MIKNNKLKLVISSLIILLPTILIAFTEESAIIAAIGISSCIMLAVHWLAIVLTHIDNKKSKQSPKVLGLLFWICPMISLLVLFINCAILFNADLKISYFVGAILGVVMIVFGNYLPKCKQNFVVGMRLSWTLANEENWNKTHRFSGKLWVLGGILMLACSLLPDHIFIFAMISIVLLMSIIPIVYSYLYYKKQLKDGRYEKIEELARIKKTNKKYLLITVIFSVLLLAFLFFISFTGSITYTFDDDSFTVDSSYSAPMTVRYLEIDKIEIRESVTPGTKVMGFNSPTLLLDVFKNSEFGKYTRYTYTRCDTCIVIDINGETLVINGESSEKTREIYESIMEHMIVN